MNLTVKQQVMLAFGSMLGIQEKDEGRTRNQKVEIIQDMQGIWLGWCFQVHWANDRTTKKKQKLVQV